MGHNANYRTFLRQFPKATTSVNLVLSTAVIRRYLRLPESIEKKYSPIADLAIFLTRSANCPFSDFQTQLTENKSLESKKHWHWYVVGRELGLDASLIHGDTETRRKWPRRARQLRHMQNSLFASSISSAFGKRRHFRQCYCHWSLGAVISG